MEVKEIIKALECCKNDDCDNCPNTFGNCYANLAGYALAIIKRQQKLIKDISQMIADNTYPYFNKDGKPVSIWNPDGYRMIEQRLKEMER